LKLADKLKAIYSKDASIGEQQLVPQENEIRYMKLPVNDLKMIPLKFDNNPSKYKGNIHNYYVVTSYKN
jgi:hypothetical protein